MEQIHPSSPPRPHSAHDGDAEVSTNTASAANVAPDGGDASTAGAVVDAPGRYVVTHKSLVVTQGPARTSGIVARLSHGAEIEVLKVESQDQGSKVRGQIEQPPGWVTLLDIDRALRGAAPKEAHRTGDGGQTRSFPASPVAQPPSPLQNQQPPPSLVASSKHSSQGSLQPSETRSDAGTAKKMEVVLGEASSRIEDLQAELEAQRVRCQHLQQQWAELSGKSDDALVSAEQARRQASSLRTALRERAEEQKALEEEMKKMSEEKADIDESHQSLEREFRRKLSQAVEVKEQQLQEERMLLRSAGEAAEARVQELVTEKHVLEQRLLASGGSGGGGRPLGGPGSAPAATKHESMLEAHMSIAHAFGVIALDHPCIRVADEPSLKFTVLLLKQPLVRRIFFIVLAFIWLFALRSMLPSAAAPLTAATSASSASSAASASSDSLASSSSSASSAASRQQRIGAAAGAAIGASASTMHV